ncbi:MAG TPA: FAD-dependent oxidoreductase [Jatrophihabitans sp.]|nr:FAD-dependent oxidoreductase [Jatrophihabitans sp.]
MQSYDVIVIGGGMAGVSIAAELAADRRILLVDMEATLAYHTTGRSAAMFLESYGGPAIRALTTASRTYLVREGMLTPLPMLHTARVGRGAAIEQLYRDVRVLVPEVELLDAEQVVARQPLLRPGATELALLEPGAMEIDVHALHQAYLRSLRAKGGEVATSARVRAAHRRDGLWHVTLSDDREVRSGHVVDAAGAWADAVARVFDAAPVGLRALRRTAFMVDAPRGFGAPMIADIDDAFYVKPDAGRLLCSPADETPQEPTDARPDEVEIARAIDVINEVTTLNVRHVRASWAGLRNFVADRTPVVGADPAVEGFFWYAAQGGYGIQTAPALARTGAALLRAEPVPTDVAERGLIAAQLAPDRPGLRVPPENVAQ